jgi:hypothetical protein
MSDTKAFLLDLGALRTTRHMSLTQRPAPVVCPLEHGSASIRRRVAGRWGAMALLSCGSFGENRKDRIQIRSFEQFHKRQTCVSAASFPRSVLSSEPMRRARFLLRTRFSEQASNCPIAACMVSRAARQLVETINYARVHTGFEYLVGLKRTQTSCKIRRFLRADKPFSRRRS